MPEEKARLEEIRALVERRSAQLEFHITLEPSAPTYDHYWQRLKHALAQGAGFDRVRDVLPEERAKSDLASGRYRLGLRWYRLSKRASEVGLYATTRLPEGEQPYVLCINDPHRITERSLQNIAHRRNVETLGGFWIVVFEVKEPDQEKMARLTSRHDEYLAIVLDGEVHAAPVLRSTLSSNGQISGRYTEEEARNLAALLCSESLPVRFALTR
jgi:preprotein translocase subunit SecD